MTPGRAITYTLQRQAQRDRFKLLHDSLAEQRSHVPDPYGPGLCVNASTDRGIPEQYRWWEQRG